MEVILSEDVEKLGRIGDVVKVKDGFARNYLIPRQKAFPATKENLKRIEHRKAQLAEKKAAEKREAEVLAEKLNNLSVTITVEVNDLEKLYGSVTEADIAKALNEEGFSVDKKAIQLDKPIEELGIFDVGVKLHPETTAKIRVWVAKK